MGVAFYIELNKDVEFETFVDRKSIANEFEEIGMDIPEQTEQW
jgi:hypothetical protein